MTKRNQRRLALALGGILCILLAAVAWMALAPDEPVPAIVRGAEAGEPFLLDLNTASAEELACLPGIGPVLAERILSRRDELGAFRSKEDILSVSGIGEAVYEKIEPYITY